MFFNKVKAKAGQRIDGGIGYLELERMAYYVHKADYLEALATEMRQLSPGV